MWVVASVLDRAALEPTSHASPSKLSDWNLRWTGGYNGPHPRDKLAPAA